jgi:tetratricopeptide (TPR) repeat protein
MLDAMSWMANAFLRQKDAERALPYFERALAIAEKARGKEDPRNFYLLVNVGGVVSRLGQRARGIELLLRAQQIGERQRRAFYPWLGLHLGEAYLAEGRVPEATALLQRAVDVFASKPNLTIEERLAQADANRALARALVAKHP